VLFKNDAGDIPVYQARPESSPKVNDQIDVL